MKLLIPLLLTASLSAQTWSGSVNKLSIGPGNVLTLSNDQIMTVVKPCPARDARTVNIPFVGDVLVHYEYDPCSWGFVPTTYPPGKPHYAANVRVYIEGTLLAEFAGTWVDGGCFEDAPTAMFSAAVKHWKERK